MTSNVTSIAQARLIARSAAERLTANTRLTSVLLAAVVPLIVIGLGATFSASSALGIDRVDDGMHFFKRQALGAGIGIVAMAATWRVRYQAYRRLAGVIYVGAVVLLLAVLVVGDRRGGSTRWIELGPLSFQPSELAKLAVVVALAAVLVRKQKYLADLGHFLAPVAATVGLVGILVMMQPDLGTSVVIGAAALAVMAASRAPLRFVGLTAGAGLALAGLMAVVAPYRMSRLRAFLDPWADPLGEGYQLLQSYTALGTGGTFGVGLGASRARWFYLPNAHNDFIFAIIGEELGLIGALMILFLLAAFTVAGVVIARRAPDPFGRMLAIGITTWLAVQALVNIGGVVGVMPITGIALPFVSFGSTALIVSMAAVGILANIARQGVAGTKR